jgi:hypothetical protein
MQAKITEVRKKIYSKNKNLFEEQFEQRIKK